MMRSTPAVWLVMSLLLRTGAAHAEDFYVAPDGNDGAAGTEQAPFATVERAQDAAAPGDTVFIRGGVYAFSGTTGSVGVSFTKSGAEGQPISYFAYSGETPIFDLFELRPNARVTGLDVHCDFIHVRGLEVRGVRQLIVGDSWGVRIRGNHNVIEQLNVHDNEAPGIFITSGAANLILNCDSHHNYDPLEDGGNADGFGCHSSGEGNVLRGCRAFENSDDGFDFINAAGACTVEESWAMRNGYIPDTDQTGANGAGFKSGGYGNPPNTPATGAAHHVVRFNVAFGNRSIGFYANYHPGAIDFLNNTAWDNPVNFDMRTAGTPSSHTLRNNVAAEPGTAIARFNGGTDDFNSWTLPVTVSNEDFVSLDTAQAYLPRRPDGSLPSMTLARLRDASDLIDKGEDLGFPFAGNAPDLGAFELGLVSEETPDGGMPDAGEQPDGGDSAGAGGESGAGGATPAGAGAAASGGATGAAGSTAGTSGAAGSAQAAGAGAAPQAMQAAGVGGQAAATSTNADPGGCGCRVTATSGSTIAPAWVAFAAWVGLRARRKRRRSASANATRG
jgi:MYXO-CTERM domain-containing protein